MRPDENPVHKKACVMVFFPCLHDANGKLQHRSTHCQDELDPNAIDSAYGILTMRYSSLY